MSQKKNLKDLTKNSTTSSEATASVVRKGEMRSAELSGTPELDRYYETGELPQDEATRELYQIMQEKGEI